jgi:serine/threonine protein kinase
MPMTDTLTCTRCGAAIPAGARFCASCGLDISSPQGSVTTVNATAPLIAIKGEALLAALREATLGEYEILTELGRGGMATVYLAHDIALDRKVAIKVMSPSLFSGEGMAERFKREARTAGQLSHPHIIPIYAVRESGDLLYFVMKFVEGRPLDSIIREVGPLPIPMVQTILQQVGSALGYAHRRGVIHRDIKPANIMLDADGWAIVTDFGIAKVSEKQGLTITGATVGTPSYMSPEQCAAKELTGASDQYSLGVVAYEMLSGKLPFVAESVMAVMYAHFNEPPPPIQDTRRDCPPELSAAVMKMLEKEPHNRFPTIEAATAAIGAVHLAPDDPIRTQMMTLASKSENLKLLERFSTPVSQPPAGTRDLSTGPRPSIANLQIIPGHLTIRAGDSAQLQATPRSRAGQTLVNRAVSWASTNTDIARVSPNGLVTAVRPGSVTLTATSENTSATAVVTVTRSRPAKALLRVAIGGVVVAGIAAAVWFSGLVGNRGGAIAQPPDSNRVSTLDSPRAGTPVPSQLQPAAPVTHESTAAAAPPPTSPTRERPPARPSTESQRLDSLSAVANAALDSAYLVRGRAVKAKVPPSDLAPGDTEVQIGQQQLTRGRPAAAIDHFQTARGMWAELSRIAEARAESAATQAAPPPTTQPSRPVTPPPPVDQKPLIRETIAAYGRAVQQRSLTALRQVYPALNSSEADGWQAFFKIAKDIQATYAPTQIDVNGDEAQVVVDGSLAYYNTDQHRQESITAGFRARLERQAGRWVITHIQQLR